MIQKYVYPKLTCGDEMNTIMQKCTVNSRHQTYTEYDEVEIKHNTTRNNQTIMFKQTNFAYFSNNLTSSNIFEATYN